MSDEAYMWRAISLAGLGEGFTAPNPMVGAVIVKDGRKIGEGYHERCGGPHAERRALSNCTEDPRGATLYVTLTPCCHWGKTGPCTEAILKAGIRRVVVGSKDLNPAVGDKSVEILRAAGIQVEENVLHKECDNLNPIFFHYITTGMPFIAMKYAMTADGKIATVTGESKWITGEEARAHVQRLRHRYSAIMVGIGTVLQDDPLLTCRMKEGKNPVRIICDTDLNLPPESHICKTAREIPVIAVAAAPVREEKRRRLEALGVRVLTILNRDGSGRLCVEEMVKRLGEEGIDSILLEGGGMLNDSVLRSGLVNKVYAFIAPKLFGGASAKSPVEGEGVSLPAEAYCLSEPQIKQFGGGDLLLEYNVAPRGEKIKCLQES